MDDALLGAEPAELRVRDQPAPEAAEVRDEVLDRRADDVRRERLDGGDADLRSAADRERQSVALDALGVIRLEHDVRGRVVRVRIHRVGAGERP